jgi:hypothetical protein
MSAQSTNINTPNETSSDVCQTTTENKQHARSVVTKVEVVNEIQSVADKRSSLHLSTPTTVTAADVATSSNDNSRTIDAKKCMSSSRSSKTNLTAVTTPSTTVTLETTATAASKHVTIQNNSSRRTSREKEKSDSSNVCGKLLKRVKNMLEKKDIKSGECMCRCNNFFGDVHKILKFNLSH